MNKYLQHLPVAIFAICVLIAFMLTIMAPSWWPAALAIAIAGSALALAFRSQDSSREIGYLTDDITVLQEQNAAFKDQMAEMKGEIVKNNEMLDELADIVQQVATLTADGGDITKAEVAALRTDISELRAMPAIAEPAAPENDTRLDDLEFRLAALESRSVEGAKDDGTASDAALGLSVGAGAGAAAAAATTASAADVGSLRSLMARATGETTAPEASPETAPEETPAAPVTNATLAPLFRPELGEPVAFLLSPTGADTAGSFSAILQHAIRISAELEEAKRENLLFVRLSSKTLADQAVCDAILAAVGEHAPLQRRLAILTDQQGFDDAALRSASRIAEEGCRFGMYDVRDWSINLASLARNGMAFILVDGPAMAQSAEDQGGDPRRLAQALGMHDIVLIAGDVATEQDIVTVRGLEPTFITGTGLGETRALEIAS